MYMGDWIAKLDEFLKISNRDILPHAGNITHKEALAKAYAEYEIYRQQRLNAPSPVEQHFREAIDKSKQIGKSKPNSE